MTDATELQKAFGSLKQPEPQQTELEEAIAERPAAAETRPTRTRTPKAAEPAPATRGKSSNPDYEKVGVYVRKKTRKDAERKWEDSTGGDFSGLVEYLLVGYLGDQ